MNEDSVNNFDLEGVTRTVTYNKNERLSLLRSLSLPERSAVFNNLSPKVREVVIDSLTFNEVVEMLDHLDPLRVHQILFKMRDKKRKARFLSRLKSDRFEKTEYFLQFHPEASLTLFHLNYLYLSEDTTVGDTANIIENHLRTTGKIPAILVSKGGKLTGEVSLGTLVRERNTNKLKNYVSPVSTVAYNTDRNKVLELFQSTPHEKVIVTDSDGSVLGVIYSDDVIDLLDAQPAATLYSFAGVEASERPFDAVFDKVRGRYRWLIINLGTCFIAGGTVSLFGETINQFVALAIFMPMIAGMGGNTSNQTFAIMIRGISTGEISLKNSYPAMMREMIAAGINGLLVSLMMVPIALFFGLDLIIAVIAGVAIVFNMIVGGFFGTLVPLVLKYIGKDPATSAGIFISTATDVIGLLFFLGLATIILL
ncbi:magnesium transporter [Candidatus Nomurabacteria bacterium]|nr:magnesium transporter [Candidatus Nomurabacteria bacterium]MCB9819129.1 magnesium transporter [Candidatus Nomurabacteria bacterium]